MNMTTRRVRATRAVVRVYSRPVSTISVTVVSASTETTVRARIAEGICEQNNDAGNPGRESVTRTSWNRTTLVEARMTVRTLKSSREFNGLPDAFRICCHDAIRMLRDCAKLADVIRKHGRIVAEEAMRELDRVDPKWWAR
jgi:hypothetical protein